jgi:hypothetical protein
MAESKITQFKTALAGGGARPNLFSVELNFPTGLTVDYAAATDGLLIKASSLPASNIGSIDVPFRGRIFKVAGDRTFDMWNVTVINDEGFKIRNAFEKWMQYIGQYGDSTGQTGPVNYMADAKVTQLTRNPASIPGADGTSANQLKSNHTYIFKDIFPTNISAIDLSYDSSDQIEEFTVEFQVQYWYKATTPNTGTP